MIYHFFWNSDFLIKEHVKNWKSIFIEKYWDFNFIEINIINVITNNALIDTLLSSWFLWEKKFIIIYLWSLSKDDINEEKINIIINNLEKIPENNIVSFVSINADKRSKLYKLLNSKCTKKEFNINNEIELWSFIEKKYWSKISKGAINKIIRYKSWNLNKIINELDKLLITFNYINESEIVNNIVPELEESIFHVIDSILNLNKVLSIRDINIILNNVNIYLFYNNLLANLRINIYIYKLKKEWIDSMKISKILNLKNRSFLVNKLYKINYSQLEKLYIWLINLDKKMKTGNLLWSDENDFKFELEKLIIKI